MEDSFVLFTKISETVSELTDEEKGKLFQAILDYQTTGEVPEMDKLIRLVFLPIKHDMDYCAEKRAEAQEQKSIAGKKSAEARAAKKATEESSETEQRSTETNTVEHRSTPLNTAQHNGNVYVNVTNKDNNPPYPPLPGGDTPKTPKTRKEKERYNLWLLAQCGTKYTMSPRLYETLEKWATYKGQHNFAYEPLGMQSLLTIVNKSVQQHGEDAVIERITASMGSGYAGMLLDKLDKAERSRPQKPNRFHNLEQRPADDIDQEAIAQMKARILGKGAP